MQDASTRLAPPTTTSAQREQVNPGQLLYLLHVWWQRAWAYAMRQPLLPIIVILHLILGILYSIVVPPWEAHDEWPHYKYAEHIARERALPSAGQRLTYEFAYDQSDQAPLYYLLIALPILLVDTSDEIRPTVNPFASDSDARQGINVAVHDPAVEGFPWRGTILALYLARWMSVLISTLGLIAVWWLAIVLVRDDLARVVAPAALAIMALSPQYTFIGSVVTNDVLATALGGFVAVCCVKIVWHGLSRWSVLGLALSLGLAILTKYTALALIPVALVALGIGLFRTPNTRKAITLLLLFVVTCLLLISGWFWRNLNLYGTPLPRDSLSTQRFIDHLRNPHLLYEGLAWEYVPDMLVYGFRTFWASFGWGNLEPPLWVFGLLAAFCGLGILGVLVHVFRSSTAWGQRLSLGVLTLLMMCVVFLPLYRELLHYAEWLPWSQNAPILRGRYVLPALPAVAVLLALGWLWWMPRRWRQPAVGILVVVMALFTASQALFTIRPAYALPPLTTDAALRPGETGTYASFGGYLELLGYRVETPYAEPGDPARVTLVWRGVEPTPVNYTLNVTLLGEDLQPYAAINLFPGRGNYATSIWKPGHVFRESYEVYIPNDMPLPAHGQFRVAFFDFQGDAGHLPVYDGNGTFVDEALIFGSMKLAPAGGITPASVPQEPGPGRLADEVALDGWRMLPRADGLHPMAGLELEIEIQWRALQKPQHDYTIFVHLLDEHGRLVVQWDGPPQHGKYPTTIWDAGEGLVDRIILTLPRELPTGTYQLFAGMYRHETGQRLPAYAPDSTRWPDDAILLDSIQIAGRTYLNFVPSIAIP